MTTFSTMQQKEKSPFSSHNTNLQNTQNTYHRHHCYCPSHPPSPFPSPFSISQQLTFLSFPFRAFCQQRLTNLQQYMYRHYNTEIRDDSRTVWNYLTNPNKADKMEDLAKELWYMKLLYSYSDYSQRCKKILPSIKYSLLKGIETYPMAKQRTWEHIQNYVLPLIRMQEMTKLMTKSGMKLKKL